MTETPDQQVKIAILETQVIGLRESIALQAREYERRLTELNHAHAQADQDRTKFITAELFYAKYDEASKWRGEMDQWRSRVIGVAIGAGMAAGVAGGGIVAGLIRLLGGG